MPYVLPEHVLIFPQLPFLIMSSRDAPFHTLVERAAPHIEHDLNWDMPTPAFSKENLTQCILSYYIINVKLIKGQQFYGQN